MSFALGNGREPSPNLLFSNENLQWPWQTLFIRCQEGCTGVVSAGSCISSCFSSPGKQKKTPPWLIRCFLNFTLTCNSSSGFQSFQLMNLWPLATVLMPLIASGRTISPLLLCKGCRETCQEQPVAFSHRVSSPKKGKLGQRSAQQGHLSISTAAINEKTHGGFPVFSTLPALLAGSAPRCAEKFCSTAQGIPRRRHRSLTALLCEDKYINTFWWTSWTSSSPVIKHC